MNFDEKESFDFLGSLFPGGLRDPALIAEFCPEGWEKSSLFACFHPSPVRCYKEHLAFRRNMRWMASLRRKREEDLGARNENAEPETENDPDPTFEEYLKEHPVTVPVISASDAIDEPAELLGLCLWDIFSDNHEVIAADGRVVDLGSFRGSGGMIADFFEQTSRGDQREVDWGSRGGWDYMRFYMGTCWVSGRADLAPAYQLIFRRLKALGADWRYAFPRLHIFDFGSGEGSGQGPESIADYNPSVALQKEQERKERVEKTRRLRRDLDRDAMDAKREARAKEPPATVRAYSEVYGSFPAGWPPDPYVA